MLIVEAGAGGWKLVATARHNFAGQTFFALIEREFLNLWNQTFLMHLQTQNLPLSLGWCQLQKKR